MQKYPAFFFHVTKPKRMVRNEAEEAALGPEWVDHPSKVAVAPEPIPEAPAHTPEPQPEAPKPDLFRRPRKER